MKPRAMKIGVKGRVVIPVGLRDAMGWKEGDEILYGIDGARVVIAATGEQLRRLRELMGAVGDDEEPSADLVRERRGRS